MNLAHPTLAIVAPDLYHASVTFLHEHIAAIAPGNTVVVHLSTTGERAKTDVPALEVQRAPDLAIPTIPLISTSIRQINEFRRNYLDEADRQRIVRFFQSHGVTHVLAEFANTAATIYPVTRKLGLPLTSISHGWDINVIGQMPQWRLRYRRFFRTDTRFIAAGPLVRDAMIRLGAPLTTAVIPCAIHADLFKPTNQNAGGTVRIVMVSRLTAQKGPLQSIAAFSRVARHRPDVVLEIVGDGPQMPDVRRAIAEAGLEKRTVLHGAVAHEEALAAMSRSHIFLQHGMTLPKEGVENQAVSLLEAMGHGLVPIVSKHGGMKIHVSQGDRGWVVDEGDTEAMALKIIEMIDSSKSRKAIGERAREYVLSNFTADKIYPRLRRLIGVDDN